MIFLSKKTKNTRDKSLVLLILIAVMFAITAMVIKNFEVLQERKEVLQKEVEVLQEENTTLQKEVEVLQEEKEALQEKVAPLSFCPTEWEKKIMEVTKYAPLDRNAVEGMCFEGNPMITASGEVVVIGVTAAAGPSFPFNTVIYIDGIGKRIIQDRGGMITDRHLDVAISCQKKALEWGRQNVTVFIKRQ